MVFIQECFKHIHVILILQTVLKKTCRHTLYLCICVCSTTRFFVCVFNSWAMKLIGLSSEQKVNSSVKNCLWQDTHGRYLKKTTHRDTEIHTAPLHAHPYTHFVHNWAKNKQWSVNLCLYLETWLRQAKMLPDYTVVLCKCDMLLNLNSNNHYKFIKDFLTF